MINYKGDFQSKQDTAISHLPAGAYVGVVVDATVAVQSIGGRNVERLVLWLDVAEGEYKGHYGRQYEAAKGGMYAAKYKGVYRITVPQPGDQYESMNKRIMQGAAWAFEQSNKGYKWDFDETKLKGLAVGFAVRDVDYLIDDVQGVRVMSGTEICKLESVADVKAGKVQTPKKRELKEAQKQRLHEYAAEQMSAQPVETPEDLPF